MAYTEKEIKFLKTLKSQWVSQEEAFNRLNQVKSQTTQWWDGSSAKTKPVSEDNFFDFGDTWQWTKNLIGWAVAQLPEIASNISSAWQSLLENTVWYLDPVRYIAPEYYEKSKQSRQLFTKDIGEKSKRWIQSGLWVDPESMLTKAWEFWAEVWASFLAPWWALKSVPWVARSLLQRAWKFWTETAIWSTAYAWISEWELPSAWDVATQGAFWWLLKWVSKAREYVTKDLPKKLFSSSIKLTPTQTKEILQPNVAWIEPEKWLIDKKISWSLTDMVAKVDDIAEKSFNKLNKSVRGVWWTYKSNSSNTVLPELRDIYKNTVWNESMIKNIDSLIDKSIWGKLSLNDLLSVKRMAYDNFKMYSKSSNPLDTAKAEWFRNIVWKLKTQIEEIGKNKGVKNIKELSKDIQVATKMSQSLQNTINRTASKDQVSLTDYILWAGVIGWAGAISQDPLTTLATLWWFIATKKILQNPKVKTNLALMLSKLNPKEQANVISATQWGVVDKNTKNKLKEMFKKAVTMWWQKLFNTNE